MEPLVVVPFPDALSGAWGKRGGGRWVPLSVHLLLAGRPEPSGAGRPSHRSGVPDSPCFCGTALEVKHKLQWCLVGVGHLQQRPCCVLVTDLWTEEVQMEDLNKFSYKRMNS